MFVALLVVLALPATLLSARAVYQKRQLCNSGFWLVLLAGLSINSASPIAKLTGNIEVESGDLGGQELTFTGVASSFADISHKLLGIIALALLLYPLVRGSSQTNIRRGTIPLVLL